MVRIITYRHYRWILLSLVLLSIALLVNIYADQPLVFEQSSGFHSGFRSENSLDPLGPISQWKTANLESGLLEFETSAPPTISQATLTFRYACDPACPEMWLRLMGAEATSVSEFLLAHPMFDDIDWLYIRDGGYTLYQKELRYFSLKAILEEDDLRVLADPYVQKEVFDEYDNVQSISEASSLDGYDVIVTTYGEPIFTPSPRIFSRHILVGPNLSQAHGNLVWQIEAASTSSAQVLVQQPVEWSF